MIPSFSTPSRDVEENEHKRFTYRLRMRKPKENSPLFCIHFPYIALHEASEAYNLYDEMKFRLNAEVM